MDARIKELLKPEILNTVNGLELVARVIVEGFMSGSNKSQAVGAGQEFSQYKNYQAGDDLRQLDWKSFARTERYYIKQAEIETNITVKFIVDASQSMAYVEENISKLQYAKVLTAALAYLARKQGDSIGLSIVNESQIKILQPRFEQQQFVRFLYELINIKTSGTWNRSNQLEQLFDHHGKELIIFLTDLYDDNGDLLNFIGRLKTPRNEVVVFHLIGKKEKDLSFEGSFTFQDMETQVRTKVNTNTQRDNYKKKFAEWLEQSRIWMLEKQVSYYPVDLLDSADTILRNFLTNRKRLQR
ncbi:DUF58 domain-containing protein [Chryseotalea sanaruensis]|uniref:DUF58 domain-containing protein n=1 Tax=Chryseotalea sanaruensis TaxID=2482724 RepID=A0A401U5H2_9BACT|nr:DUF58 domain-containing protein [Chryseotalea sanaruensis]GCC50036.1 DUF58 domain-containing protein [Chryseotalea sanaruensis]